MHLDFQHDLYILHCKHFPTTD